MVGFKNYEFKIPEEYFFIDEDCFAQERGHPLMVILDDLSQVMRNTCYLLKKKQLDVRVKEDFVFFITTAYKNKIKKVKKLLNTNKIPYGINETTESEPKYVSEPPDEEWDTLINDVETLRRKLVNDRERLRRQN